MVDINKRKVLANGIRQTFRNGFIVEIINPKGKKGMAIIFQGRRAGFTAKNSKGRFLGTSRNAEAFGRKLARAGYKKVVFRD